MSHAVEPQIGDLPPAPVLQVDSDPAHPAAHGFRHTHAAELRGEGVDIGIISRQLGHKSLLTTIIYLDHIAPTAVIDAMRKRTWRGGEGD